MDTLLRRRMMFTLLGGSPTPPTPLPYDAEIEYLQSTGSQYIDTLYTGNINTHIECRFFNSTYVNCLYGCIGNNTNDITCFTNPLGGVCRFGNKSYTVRMADNVAHTVIQSKTAIVVDGTSYAFNTTASFTTPSTLFLFCVRMANLTPDYYWTGRLYYLQISENGTFVRDLIPVRVGTVGYMYDRVSGQLFGNSGTGNFILGNDKNS